METVQQEYLQIPTQISNYTLFLPQSKQNPGRTETGHEQLKLLKYLLLQPARIAPGFFRRAIAKKEPVCAKGNEPATHQCLIYIPVLSHTPETPMAKIHYKHFLV